MGASCGIVWNQGMDSLGPPYQKVHRLNSDELRLDSETKLMHAGNLTDNPAHHWFWLCFWLSSSGFKLSDNFLYQHKLDGLDASMLYDG